MKQLERSSSKCNGTVQKFDQPELLGKEQIKENEKKERAEEEEDGGMLVKSTGKASRELPEEYFHGLEDLPWNLASLEQSLYLSLPVWVQTALLCNLAGQYGIWTFHNNYVPCRVISYFLLPYTLPAVAMASIGSRLLSWTSQIIQRAMSVLTGVTWSKALISVFTLLHFKTRLLDRSNHSPPSTGSSALSISRCSPPTTPPFKSPNPCLPLQPRTMS